MKVPDCLLRCVLVLFFLVTGFGEDGISMTGEWGPWTECSVECGGGVQARTKICSGDLCDKIEASCHLMPCDDPYVGKQWSVCTRRCNGGTRSVIGDNGQANGETSLAIRCNTHSCTPTRGDCIGDVVFVVDSSGSIGSKNWKTAVQFVIDVVKGLKVSKEGTHVSVLTFSTTVEVSFGLNEFFSVSDIEPVVFDLTYMAGVTNTADAIKVMHEQIKSEGRDPEIATPIAVIITDGVPTIDAPRTELEATSAKEDGIEIFVVEIGDETDIDVINEIATNESYVFRAADYESVQDLTVQIAERICFVAGDMCSRCNYTNGQLWKPDLSNCHLFYICEPLGNGLYRVHHATCGQLFWHQAYHTCVPVRPEHAKCADGPVSPYIQPTTTESYCPYEPYPGDPSKFWIPGDALTISDCLEGMQFVHIDDLCDCLPAGPLNPTCSDNLLLHFPYEEHYNDVTCHQAIATQYGDGVHINYDSDRDGNVACFTGNTHFEVSFLRTWFANNKVDKFTVAVWFKRLGEDVTPQGIVNNGDCVDTPGFLIGHSAGSVAAEITTDVGGLTLPTGQVSPGQWHHVAWVYDGQYATLYVDKVPGAPMPITGYLTNNDVPMYIANCCGEHFFTGCLDELRVYDRVLTATEVNDLP